MKRLVGTILLLSATAAWGQQGDAIRVRLFTNQKLQRVGIEPVSDASLRTCENCPPGPLAAPRSFVTGRSQKVTVTGSYRLLVNGARPIALRDPLEIATRHDAVVLTLTLGLEDYIAMVLAGESSRSDPEESLKAMAVVARTYAKRNLGRHAELEFDFCDTTHCQDLRLDEASQLRHAVADTQGQLLWFNGEPAETYYHQDCGGQTAAVDEQWPASRARPYLRSQPDPYCIRSESVRWNSTLDKHELIGALARSQVQLEPSGISVAERTRSGRAKMLKFGDAKVSASTVRFAVGRVQGWNLIRSDFYELRDEGPRVIFTGRGSGHGVGMCQRGALQMAKTGRNYAEILAFYFPGTELALRPAQAFERIPGTTMDLLTTNRADRPLLQQAEAMRAALAASSGLQSSHKLALKIFPTVDAFRDATGEPGWVAASTRGETIQLQPLALLQRKQILDSTLRHELAHELVETNSRARTPLWFREGLVLTLADERQAVRAERMDIATVERVLRQRQDAALTEAAYVSARIHVDQLERQHGRKELYRWLRDGIPAAVLRATVRATDGRSGEGQSEPERE